VYGYRDQVKPLTATVAELSCVSLAGSGWWISASPRAVLVGYRETVRRILPLPDGFGEASAIIDEQGWWIVASAAGAMIGCKDGPSSRLYQFEGEPAARPVHVAMNDGAEWLAAGAAGLLHGRRDQLVLSLPFASRPAVRGVDLNADGRWVVATDRGVLSGRKDQVLVSQGR
jgi:hypothetical protein